MPLILIYNPACGDHTGKTFFENDVLPFLKAHSISTNLVVETTHVGHAGEVAARFVKDHASSKETLSIVLGSGDGTFHEVINAIYDLWSKESYREAQPKIRVALVPCGTANALYSSLFPVHNPDQMKTVDYRLQSVKAFVEGRGGAPLSLATTRLRSNPSNGGEVKTTKSLLSAVVASTSLHAAILHYSEALRQEHPGLERFKMAAEQNSTKWYKARARLLGEAEIYDPNTKTFKPVQSGTSNSVELQGPFAYFLSTVNVDRLEPTFLITPLSRRIPAPANTCEILIVRPFRDPSVQDDSDETKKAFVPKTWAALMGAYQAGNHVNLQLDSKGTLLKEGGEGIPMVEYYRCSGWEWYPDKEDEDAHLVCSDGAINRIDKSGWAECRVSTAPSGKPSFEIYTP